MHVRSDQGLISVTRLVNMTNDLGLISNKLRKMNMNITTILSLLFLTIALQLVDRTVYSQVIGTQICACQPATYTFTFDFANNCADTNVNGTGINATACLAEIRGEEDDPNADLVPVSVSSIQIFELDQQLQVVAQTLRSGVYQNGSSFTYTSIIATQTDTLNPLSLPRGLQLVITGLNAVEQSVVQTWVILYTNDCSIFPILFEGQIAGWTVFTDLGPPPQLVCPLAPSPAPTTLEPQTTAFPSQKPTTFILTPAPTASPIAGTLLPTTAKPVNDTATPTLTTDTPTLKPSTTPSTTPEKTSPPSDKPSSAPTPFDISPTTPKPTESPTNTNRPIPVSCPPFRYETGFPSPSNLYRPVTRKEDSIKEKSNNDLKPTAKEDVESVSFPDGKGVGKTKEGKKKDKFDGKMDKLDKKLKAKRILRVGNRPTRSPSFTRSPSLECPEPIYYRSPNAAPLVVLSTPRQTPSILLYRPNGSAYDQITPEALPTYSPTPSSTSSRGQIPETRENDIVDFTPRKKDKE